MLQHHFRSSQAPEEINLTHVYIWVKNEFNPPRYASYKAGTFLQFCSLLFHFQRIFGFWESKPTLLYFERCILYLRCCMWYFMVYFVYGITKYTKKYHKQHLIYKIQRSKYNIAGFDSQDPRIRWGRDDWRKVLGGKTPFFGTFVFSSAPFFKGYDVNLSSYHDDDVDNHDDDVKIIIITIVTPCRGGRYSVFLTMRCFNDAMFSNS